MTKHPLHLLACAVLAGCACSKPALPPDATAHGAEPPSSALYLSIADRDAALTTAFNAHDVDALMALFGEDLEFYHDVGGLQRYADVRAAFTGLFGQDNGIRRELVPGSLRVYPVKNYGAMEIGSHRFCHLENGKQDCGTFEFVQIWRQSRGTWKMTRVASYGH